MKQVRPERIRARITPRRIRDQKARYQHGSWIIGIRLQSTSWVHWHMEITDGKKVIHRDDCRDLAKLHEEATRLVESYRLLVVAGHKFKSWDQLVDEAVI